MDTDSVYEQTTVIHELTQGIEMAKQLRVNLNSPEAREFLIQKILSSYDKAIFILESGGQPRASRPLPESSQPKSSITADNPQSTEFELDQIVVSKKRKASTPWEYEVRIWSENELESNTNENYSWRKYGQKDIIGSKFPRSYYKCSYKKVQNCLAKKQVKRTDENPKVFEITYKGKHTCNTAGQSAPPPPSSEKYEIKPTHHHHHHHHQLSSTNPGEILSNLRANLSVNTCDLGATLHSSFSPPSTLFEFSDDDFHPLEFPSHFDEELLQGYSPSFISPATSESNYFANWASSSSSEFPMDLTYLYPDFTS